MGQGFGASHRGLVTSDTDQRGPGVASQGKGHGATATRGAQNSPPVNSRCTKCCRIGMSLSNKVQVIEVLSKEPVLLLLHEQTKPTLNYLFILTWDTC